MKQSIKPLLTNPNKQTREQRLAFTNERIYGSVTVLAINVGLLVKDDSSISNAFITIVSTVFGLWLASLFAAVVAYRVVHDSNMPRHDFIHELTAHRGLLVAGIPSLAMLGLAALGLIALPTAIIASISLAAISTVVTVLRSGKTKSNSIITALTVAAIQAVVVGLIIVVKLGAK